MKRIHALVEGQTEEAFLAQLVAPHLRAHGAHLTPIVVATRRLAGGPSAKGGTVSYAAWKAQAGRLLGDSSAALVTTMLDFYALPGDWPRPAGGSARERVLGAMEAMAADIADARFAPFVMLHEFEALVFTDPRHVCDVAFASPAAYAELARVRAACVSPEEIDDGPDTHPSARIVRLVPGYRKSTHGPIAAERIGLPALRAACPHFAAWLARLESVAAGDLGDASPVG